MAVFQGPSRDAFFGSLDDPFYEPCDRLLIRRASRIVSHLHLTPRVMHFGGQQMPVTGLCSLGTLPEFRHQGYARRLLAKAERAMLESDVVLGVLSTKVPHFFRASGWAVCGRHSHALARTRDLLSQLSARGIPPAEGELNIRPWRQIELPALMRLYAAHTAQAYGAIDRTEAYWRWLVGRPGFDQIYVAMEGPERFSLDALDAPIVGYAITKEDRVLELVADPARPLVAEQLLARACGEAIERDDHSVQLHAPPDHALFELFRLAGGSVHLHEAHQGEVFMVKLFAGPAALRLLGPQLQARAVAADLPSRTELGLLVEGTKYQLVVSRRGVSVAENKMGRSYLRCNQAEFTRLVLGHLDLEDAIDQGRLEASTRLARQTAQALFPRLPLWRSPWDEIFI
jgi:GNAT superfamily N-acetyltransferase